MKRSLASVVTACAAAFPAAATAGNMSLTVQGTPGSIEVRSFGFGAKQAVTFGGGGGAGKAEIGEFTHSSRWIWCPALRKIPKNGSPSWRATMSWRTPPTWPMCSAPYQSAMAAK